MPKDGLISRLPSSALVQVCSPVTRSNSVGVDQRVAVLREGGAPVWHSPIRGSFRLGGGDFRMERFSRSVKETDSKTLGSVP